MVVIRIRVEVVSGGARFLSPKLNLALAADYPIQKIADGVWGEFTLEQQQSASFELHELDPIASDQIGVNRTGRLPVIYGDSGLLAALDRQVYLQGPMARDGPSLRAGPEAPRVPAHGRHSGRAHHELPEAIGGERNWDYRYTWIRDAAFTLYALLRIGFTEEAAQFMSWIEKRCHEMEADGSLNIMYGIDGRHDLREETLDHLEGYRGSSPVRIGNGAYDQLQLDIYGELMDSVYLYNKYGSPISYDLWRYLRRLTNWVCDHWKKKDEGIWEVRSGRQHFLYSRLMCWVAIDRALRLADKRSFPGGSRSAGSRSATKSTKRSRRKAGAQTATRSCSTTDRTRVDAALLMMPLVFFHVGDRSSNRAHCGCNSASARPSAALFRMVWCTDTTRRRHRTACGAGKAHSTSAHSGWWTR